MLFWRDRDKARLKAESADLALDFKEGMKRNAGAVAIITTAKGSKLAGLTAISTISLSIDPPSLAVSVNQNASAHSVILESKTFAVNILGEEQAHIARLFADKSARDRRFKEIQWSRRKAGRPDW